MSAHYAIILAGGKGERFWPMSTSEHPKQVLTLVGDKSMMAQAVDRLDGIVEPSNVFVITSADLVDVVKESAPMLPAENVIGEPFGRDTAAAIALGAAIIKARDPDAAFCVLTADHVIGDLPIFSNTLTACLSLALNHDILLTIGIQPIEPSTGYGYIESGDTFARENDIEFLSAKTLCRKT